MKRMVIPKILIHTYMGATVLALLLTFIDQDASRMLYAVGAHSCVIALGVGGAENTNMIVGPLLYLWFTAFPVLLIVFYIMVCKKDLYTPFCIITIIDSFISLSWFIYCALNNTVWHKYAAEYARPDGIVSILYSTVLIISVIIGRTRDSSTD